MQQLINTIVSERHQRYARADLHRAIVRRAVTAADWDIVAQLRSEGFRRVPGVSADGPWLDEIDGSPAAFSLIGFTLDGTPLTTMRVQDSRLGPLELGRFIDLEAVLSPSERPAAQCGRLSVLRSPESSHVLFATCKTAWKWALEQGLETILLATPAWSKSIYDFLQFHSIGEAGRFQHQYAGGATHETMKLAVQTAERDWRANGQPLSDAFFLDKHPLLQA